MKEQNNEAKVDLSAVKWILRYRFINGAKKEDELKSIIDNIHVGSAEMPSIKLMALMEMKELSFQDVYELVLKKETKKTGDCESYKVNETLRSIVIKSISQYITFSQNIELCAEKHYLFRNFCESIGLKYFTAEQIKEFSLGVKNLESHNNRLREINYECFMQISAEFINWQNLLKETSLDECIEICKNIDRGKNYPYVWGAFLEDLWENLNEKKQDDLVKQINNSSAGSILIKKRPLTNGQILDICRKWKNFNLWIQALDRIDWSLVPTEEINQIIEDAEKDGVLLFSLGLVRVLKINGDCLKKINKINRYNDWSFTKEVLENIPHTFKQLLKLPKIIDDKPSGLLMIGCNNLTDEEFDTLVENGFLSWGDDAVTYSKTSLMCLHAILKYGAKHNSWKRLYQKVSDDEPSAEDIIKICETIISNVNQEVFRDLAYNIPWGNYSPEEIIKICKASNNNPHMLDRALEKTIGAINEKLFKRKTKQ